MLFSVPTEKYEIDPELARALEIILVLHMDHEQNASTSTVRTAGDPSPLISASSWGHVRLHEAFNSAFMDIMNSNIVGLQHDLAFKMQN